MKMNLRQADLLIRKELQGIYPPEEIRSLSLLVLTHCAGIPPVDIHSNPDQPVSESALAQINKIIDGLKIYKPVQYMMGTTQFYGLQLKVNEDVLIPRPETEELVHWILSDYSGTSFLRILDIGTGSGNIALALAKNLVSADVWATDNSAPALHLAKENARENGLMVHFVFSDILHAGSYSLPGQFDVIVSNPPYIPESEKNSLPRNVADFEPQQALFVPDDDPLIFYRKIISFAQIKLKQGGAVYVETHENFACEVADLFRKEGFLTAEIREDINEKNRMVKASL